MSSLHRAVALPLEASLNLTDGLALLARSSSNYARWSGPHPSPASGARFHPRDVVAQEAQDRAPTGAGGPERRIHRRTRASSRWGTYSRR